MAEARYPFLFRSGTIGPIHVPNRVVMSPLTSNFADGEGHVTEQLIGFYEARAAGGVGLVIVEGAVVSPEGKGAPRQLMVHSDGHVPGLRQLSDAVHAHGVPVVLQLIHQGRQTSSAVSGHHPVAASAITDPVYKQTPAELTIPEIARVVDDFAAAAARARRAGYDGVELHGAHGYLITNFLSGSSNRRTDRYGGPLENRSRFLLEIVARIAEVAGADFPVLVRLSAEEWIEGGIDLAETTEVCQELEKAGVVAIDVSAGTRETHYRLSPTAGTPEGVNTPLAAAIRSRVNVPVLVVGRFRTPAGSEAALARGDGDFVVLGRPLIVDAEWAAKTATGREESIARCIGCNVCAGRTRRPEIRCPVNPFVGREREWQLRPADPAKRVLVVGSGWAGLEAARIAALRGHDVTVVESGAALGGLSTLRARTPMQGELLDAVAFWREALRSAGARVHTDTAPLDHLATTSYDVVLDARPAPSPTPAVAGAPRTFTVTQALAGEGLPGGSWVVLGASLIAAETAAYLAASGRQVTLLSPAPRIADDTNATLRHYVTEMLAEHGVQWRTEHAGTAAECADAVVLDIPPAPGTWEPAEDLVEIAPQVFRLGDSFNPSELVDLVEAAAGVALEL